MPYDEDGKFTYPLPARKGKVASKVAVPKVTATVPTSPTPAATGSFRQPVSLPAPTAKVEPDPVEILPETENLTALVLPQPPTEATFTVQEGNNRWQMSELDLAYIWNAQVWPDNLKLSTADGRPVEVIYRGRWSGGFGPDFKGALVRIGDEMLKGAVELHLRSSDWRLHGHHQDARYNEVVLQVVLEDNPVQTGVSQTNAGLTLPVVALLPLYNTANEKLAATLDWAKKSGTRLGSLSESEGPCCDRVAERLTDLTALLTRLDELGDRRFEERVNRFEIVAAADEDRTPDGAVQALWAGLLEALGYSQNKVPFKRLAALLPLAGLVEQEREARFRRENAGERLLNLEAWLLGGAGLLPSQRKLRSTPRHLAEKPTRFDLEPEGLEIPADLEDFGIARYTEELERRWAWLERQQKARLPDWSPMQATDWTFARLRPPNHPARRLAGLARWLLKWQLDTPTDLVEKLTSALDGPASEANSRLNNLLKVELSEDDTGSYAFWSRRYDFGDRAIMAEQLTRSGPVDLIGPDRAADISVNIVLPFLVAYGRDRHQAQLTRQAAAAYQAHPKLASNELVENVARQVFRHWLENPTEAAGYLATLPGKSRPVTLSIGRLLDGARRQQGMLYLHHNFCAEHQYGTCPLA